MQVHSTLRGYRVLMPTWLEPGILGGAVARGKTQMAQIGKMGSSGEWEVSYVILSITIHEREGVTLVVCPWKVGCGPGGPFQHRGGEGKPVCLGLWGDSVGKGWRLRRHLATKEETGKSRGCEKQDQRQAYLGIVGRYTFVSC